MTMLNKTKKLLTIFIVFYYVLVLSGCGNTLSFFKNKEPEQLSNLAASSILVDASEIRSQTIQIINNAKRAIFIQLSALDDPEILDLLVDKSQDGVEIRILLDQWQRENSATVKYLKNQNISVQYYPAQKGQYQRVRYMVIDYQVGIFFGIDWTKKGFSSHSLAIKLTGDTAWTMAKSFDKDWTYTTTLSLALPEKIELPEDNITFTVNAGVKQQILRQINSATSTIKVGVEQLSYPETVDALIEAKVRGCEIRLLLSPSCAVATPNTIEKFKQAQIEIRYFSHPDKLPISLNIGVFDDKTIIMTSSSWTYPSFIINHEGSLTIPSPSAVEKINNIFELEWKNGTAP